jgi:hypothetical protein
MDVGINIVDAVQHAFHVYDNLDTADFPGEPEHIGISRDATPIEPGDRSNENSGGCAVPEDRDRFDDDGGPGADMAGQDHQSSLEDSATTPLFAGAQLSTLSATLLILNCLRIHGASNALISELLMLLCKSVLPAINSLPSTEYAASKMLRQLGLSYELIHACLAGCMLFRGTDGESLNECLKCKKPRYKRVGKSLVPSKVLRYFPLIPRLQRLYSTPALATLMTWHRQGRSTDGMIRHVVDGVQWKWVDQHLGNFGEEDRNIRLALATDGVNPYGVKRTNWSTWPVCLLNYNVPSWLTTKKHFIMLSMIILGKESVTCETFDVYIQPLIEELHTLWSDGVWTRDAANYR